MLYSTPVPVDNAEELSRSIFRFIPKRIWTDSVLFPVDRDELFKHTTILPVLEKYNWTNSIEGISVVVVPGKKILPIHHDWGTLTHSFNIPIINCANTWTIWYRIDEDQKDLQPGQYQLYNEDTGTTVEYTYYEYNDARCTEIERLEVTTPHLLNVRQPHSVWNPTTGTRLMLAIRLAPDFQKP
jgi:hypothetical protein